MKAAALQHDELETKPGLCLVVDNRERDPLELRAATARAAAVAKFRELADRLESGELWSARVQWRDGLHHIETVEGTCDVAWRVSLLRYEIQSPERPVEEEV